MTVMALIVVGAAILLTWMVVHSYSGGELPLKRRTRRAAVHTGHGDGWMYVGGDASASDCSPGDAGGGCGDGGGGGGD